MAEAFESILVMLAALLPVVNPLGSAPLFLAINADLAGVVFVTLAVFLSYPFSSQLIAVLATPESTSSCAPPRSSCCVLLWGIVWSGVVGLIEPLRRVP